MVNLNGKHIYLRALEPEDLEFLYQIENNTKFWELSHTQLPFSKYILREYLKNAKQDIYEAKQLRLAICKLNTETIGLIDVFDFDFKNKRAGIGIIINNEANRQQGFGKEAIQLLVDYCFNSLHLHQVYANITANNTASLALFKSCSFNSIGTKKDWVFNGKTYQDEYFLQRINN